MRGILIAATVVLCAPALPARCAAQRAPDVSGTWAVTWAQAVRVNRDDTVEIQKWGQATLVLRQEGDRVAGEWTTDILERVTWKVTGTLVGNRLTFTATEHDSDNPQLAMVQEMRWRATLTGDALEGETTLVFRRAARPQPWRPWRARREPPTG